MLALPASFGNFRLLYLVEEEEKEATLFHMHTYSARGTLTFTFRNEN